MHVAPTVGMKEIQERIVIDLPVRTVYDQWTQFETFPTYMEDVLAVEQIDATHLRWRVRVSGADEEWESEITKQIPDHLITWRNTRGRVAAGSVSFVDVDGARTQVDVSLAFEPRTPAEALGGALGIAGLHVRNELRRFRDFLEARGRETGAWRGEVSAHSDEAAREHPGA